jgi:hypothetical protein
VCISGSKTIMMGVRGAVLAAEVGRRMVTSRLLMRPYPADKDREAIAVELPSEHQLRVWIVPVGFEYRQVRLMHEMKSSTHQKITSPVGSKSRWTR